MKERLIEIVDKAKKEYAKDVTDHTETEYIVENLLNEGVIVPPCNVGQTIYRNIIDKPLEFNVIKIEVFEDGMLFIDDVGKWFCVSDIGKLVFLSREEAEKKLKERDSK